MKRKTTKFAVIVISILLAELIHDYIQELLMDWVHESEFGLYSSVLISMVVAVVVFYPAFNVIEKYLHYASSKYVEGAKKISKNGFLGLVIGFFLALFLLFIGFSELWFQKNPVTSFF
jgi:hypothetical protein